MNNLKSSFYLKIRKEITLTIQEKNQKQLETIEYLAADISNCVSQQRRIADDNRGYYGTYGFENCGVVVTSENSKSAIKRKIKLLRSMLLDLSKEIK